MFATDDISLLHYFKKNFKDSIFFVKDKEAVVTTLKCKNIISYFSQKIRWISSSKQVLDRDTILIFPFSSIEQHGEHLPLNTDKKILRGILKKFSENYKSNKYLIMPEIHFGSASEHSSFDGTISLDSLEFISTQSTSFALDIASCQLISLGAFNFTS